MKAKGRSTPKPATGPERRTPPAPSHRIEALVALGLVAVTLAVYWPVCANDFVDYDDQPYVTENPYVQAGLTSESLAWAFTATHTSNWHPLTWLSLQLDYELYELEARGFHRTNLLFHAANALLLFVSLRLMTGTVWRSSFVAALFALHPLHVESVAWVAERKDILSTFFWMLTLLAYYAYTQRPSLLRYLPVVLALALGLLAKPMLVTLPCVLLLLDYWPLRRVRWQEAPAGAPWSLRLTSFWRSWRPLLLEKAPLFALILVAAIVTVIAQETGGAIRSFEQVPLETRVLNAITTYGRYLLMTLWPSGLAVYYPLRETIPSWQALFAGLVLVSISILAVRLNSKPYLLVGWLWYLGTLVPVIGLIQVGSQALADRYTYVPLIGVFLMATWGIGDLFERQRWPVVAEVVAACITLFTCAILTRSQISHWQNSNTLWEHTLAVTTDNAVAHHNLGSTLSDQGRLPEAVQHFQAAIRIRPDDPGSHFGLALALQRQGRLLDAKHEYEEALRLAPHHPQAHDGLGFVLAAMGRPEEAVAHFEESIRLNPYDPKPRHNLGSALVAQEKFAEAIPHYRQALAMQPQQARYHYELAYALQEVGQLDEANEHYREAVRLDPRLPGISRQAAWTLATHPNDQYRNGPLALQFAKQANQATGNRAPEYLDTLAAAYAAAGRFDDAVKTQREALKYLVNQPELTRQYQKRLELYENRMAYRQFGE